LTVADRSFSRAEPFTGELCIHRFHRALVNCPDVARMMMMMMMPLLLLLLMLLDAWHDACDLN